jgi:hypothetical protein
MKPGDRINPTCSSKSNQHGKDKHLFQEGIKGKHYTEKLT